MTVIDFCEHSRLPLRLSCAILAIVEGHQGGGTARIAEAKHWIDEHLGHQPVAPPEGMVDAGRHMPTQTHKQKRGPKPKAEPKPIARPVAVQKPSHKPAAEHPWRFASPKPLSAGKGKKFCSQCGEARGVRSFVGGGNICMPCQTGVTASKKQFKRAGSLAEAERMSDDTQD